MTDTGFEWLNHGCRAFAEPGLIARTRRAYARSGRDGARCLITRAALTDEMIRSFIEDNAGLKVFNEYGCGEVGGIPPQSEQRRSHVMSDGLVPEYLSTEELCD